MNRNIIIIILSINFSFSQSFSNMSFVGPKSTAMAGAVVSDTDNIETVFYNPAGITHLNKNSVIMGITRLYGLGFLKHQFVAFTIPNKNTSMMNKLAISYQQLGTDHSDTDINLSSEKSISISQGFDLLRDANSSLSIGYSINGLIFYQNNSAGPNGDGTGGLPSSESTILGIDLGIHSSLRGKIDFGVFIKNINNPAVGKGSSQSHFPRRIDVGISYTPVEDLQTTFAFQRVLGGEKNSFRFGLEYNLLKTLTVRSGIQINPNRFGFGIAYRLSNKLQNLELSYSLLTHPVLSQSNILSVKVNFNE